MLQNNEADADTGGAGAGDGAVIPQNDEADVPQNNEAADADASGAGDGDGTGNAPTVRVLRSIFRSSPDHSNVWMNMIGSFFRWMNSGVIVATDVSISNHDFRTDEGGTPEWNFKEMLEAGQSYLDLPVPRKLTPRIRDLDPDSMLDMKAMLPRKKFLEIDRKRSEACNILRYLSPQYLSVMAHSDIGLGTDPERSEEHILNKKRQILAREIFATCLFCPGLCETVQTVHTITKESQLSNGKKIDFGIAGGFEGVQLGFIVVNETSDWSHDRRIIAIADLRYQWATTEARIHREKLYKFLTKDCKDALEKINGEADSELSRELSHFIEKYGTHVVLRCTHGYRMEKVEIWNVTSAESLQDFKAGIMASVLGYAGINAEYQKKALKADKRTENSLGIKNIGSKEHMKEALEGGMGIDFFEKMEKMMRYSGEEGDAGVISHDWNMMIAEMLLAKDSPYKTAAKRLRYWTHVRINDLKAGWEGGLFSVSYELKFAHTHKEASKENTKNCFPLFPCGKHPEQTLAGKSKNGVCVTIGGLEFVHKHPGSPGHDDIEFECLASRVTNVHTNDATRVHVSVLDDALKLKDVLAEITVFKRFLANNGVEGLVLASKINTSFISGSKVGVELGDFPGEYVIDDHHSHDVVGTIREETIGSARAKVCRQN